MRLQSRIGCDAVAASRMGMKRNRPAVANSLRFRVNHD